MKITLKQTITSTLLVFAIATQVASHTGAVGIVKADMDSMAEIKDDMQTLGKMANREINFDALQAKAAAAQIEYHAAQLSSLFQQQDMSGPS